MSKIYFENMMVDGFKYIAPSPSTFSNPIWWKNMKKDDGEIIFNRTIRSCPAVSDAINSGYILYTQVDLYIKKIDGENNFHWKIPLDFIDMQKNILFQKNETINFNHIQNHFEEQIKGYPVPENFYSVPIKWHTGFSIRTEDGYSSLICHPFHRNDLPFRVLDAVMDTDVFPAREPFAMLLKNNFSGIIPAGTPMLQVVPFKREDFQMEIIEYSSKDHFEKNLKLNRYFINRYKKSFWKRKIYK